MALYDNYRGAEDRLRFDPSNQIPKIAAPQEFAPQQAGGSSELTPNFIGGAVDPTTGNLVPGTRQKVSRGQKVTALPTPPSTAGATPSPTPSTPIPPPATPTSLLATV